MGFRSIKRQKSNWGAALASSRLDPSCLLNGLKGRQLMQRPRGDETSKDHNDKDGGELDTKDTVSALKIGHKYF